MAGKTAKSYADDYTRPKLRERLKEKLKRSDKGGRKGQWSARKSQLLTQEYERKGGGYKGRKTGSQKSLEAWTAQDWQTVKGGAHARRDGKMHRYLPAKAWSMLSSAEQRRAEKTKIRKDAKGRQFADWPKPVHEAMTAAGYTARDPSELPRTRLRHFASNLDISGRSSMSKRELIRALRAAEAGGRGSRDGASKQELYEEARRREIRGRSRMSRQELAEALGREG